MNQVRVKQTHDSEQNLQYVLSNLRISIQMENTFPGLRWWFHRGCMLTEQALSPFLRLEWRVKTKLPDSVL